MLASGIRRHRKPTWRDIKKHRSYDINEASKATGLSKGTIRNWIKRQVLPAITDQRPFLILGEDLADHLKAKSQRREKLEVDQFYCFTCREARRPGGMMADYLPLTAVTGNLRALCGTCTTVMHKAVSGSILPELALRMELSFPQGGKHLVDMSSPSLNRNLE